MAEQALPAAAAPARVAAVMLDRRFVSAMGRIAIPVALQALVSSSRTVVDSVLTSRLGTDQVAAVGYGGRVVFVGMLAVLGMADGGGVMLAQCWGRGERERASRMSGLVAAITLSVSAVVAVVCFVFSRQIVELGTSDPRVVAFGSSYVRMAIGMVLPYGVISCLAAALRCVGEPRISLWFSLLGLTAHIIAAEGLIYGRWGLPALGVRGSGAALLISTCLECLGLLTYLRLRRHRMALRLKDMVSVRSGESLGRILRVSGPVSLSSTSWAIGILVYSILVARSGVRQLAALSMISPLESFAIALLIGLSSAAAVLTGRSLGAGRPQEAMAQGKALLAWTAAVAVVIGLVLASARWWIGALYRGVGPAALADARTTTAVLAVAFFFRAMSITLQNGLLRAGGDTIFVLRVDLFTQWAVAIPLTWLASAVWKLPFPAVFAAINMEEVVKSLIAGRRFAGGRWLRNLFEDHVEPPGARAEEKVVT